MQQVPLTALYQEVKDAMRGPTQFPQSCFEPWFERELASLKTYIRSETRDGWPLDSVRTNNPNYPYADNIDVAGAWVDKLLAMQFLAARGSVAEEENANGMALLDIDSVQHRFRRILATLALGKNYPQDVVFVDKNGRTVEPQTPHRWDPNRQIAPIASDLNVIKQHFDLQPVGRLIFVKELPGNLSSFHLHAHPGRQRQSESIINLTRAGQSLAPERVLFRRSKVCHWTR